MPATLPSALKWPNDVLVGERKLAGILAEQSPDESAVVIGIGVNVATPADALPVSPAGLPATSLLVEGATVSREALLLEVLRELERWYVAFRADPDPVRTGLLDAYRSAVRAPWGSRCGSSCRSAASLTGRGHATSTPSGRLLIVDGPGDPPVPVSAGDVVHVRPAR